MNSKIACILNPSSPIQGPRTPDMTIKYFNGSTWEKISREERFFCSLLYHDIRTGNNLDRFIRFLNAVPSPLPDDASSPIPKFKNTIDLNPYTYWEIGYEACFYRDMIYHIKEKTIGTINKKRQMQGNPEIFPPKRTFDLCLFSNDHIVIIEAKVQQGLKSKQCEEFKDDEKYLDELFAEINLPCPEITFIVLASSQYLKSPSFTLTNGVGKNLIENAKYLKGFISWKQISEMYNNELYIDADAKYKN
jgi:hypothetical protein